MSKPYVRLDKNDAAVLLVDHQTGLLSLVQLIGEKRCINEINNSVSSGCRLDGKNGTHRPNFATMRGILPMIKMHSWSQHVA